jgi:hypothetical protein
MALIGRLRLKRFNWGGLNFNVQTFPGILGKAHSQDREQAPQLRFQSSRHKAMLIIFDDLCSHNAFLDI